MNRFVLALAALFTLALPAAASAQAVPTFNFDFNNSNFSAYGTLTASAPATPAGTYLITGINGSVTTGGNTTAIDGLGVPNTLAVADGTYTFDNLLNLTSSSLFTGSGLLFTSGGNDFNIFGNGNGTYSGIDTINGHTNYQGNISGTLNVAAVPEPATWAMMLVGFGAIGFAMRRGRKADARFLPQLA